MDYTHSPHTGVNELKCSQCGYNNPEGSKFCEQCGVELTRKCLQCSNEVSSSAKFCKECGYSLAQEMASPKLSKPAQTEPTSFVNDRY